MMKFLDLSLVPIERYSYDKIVVIITYADSTDVLILG